MVEVVFASGNSANVPVVAEPKKRPQRMAKKADGEAEGGTDPKPPAGAGGGKRISAEEVERELNELKELGAQVAGMANPKRKPRPPPRPLKAEVTPIKGEASTANHSMRDVCSKAECSLPQRFASWYDCRMSPTNDAM
eukprot:9492443-Pyramimonas_sp.AAC.3